MICRCLIFHFVLRTIINIHILKLNEACQIPWCLQMKTKHIIVRTNWILTWNSLIGLFSNTWMPMLFIFLNCQEVDWRKTNFKCVHSLTIGRGSVQLGTIYNTVQHSPVVLVLLCFIALCGDFGLWLIRPNRTPCSLSLIRKYGHFSSVLLWIFSDILVSFLFCYHNICLFTICC